MSLFNRPIVFLLTLGLFVQICIVGLVCHRSGRIDTLAFNSLDCQEYYQIAVNLAEHGSFSQSQQEPLESDTWRTPGYPLFLSLFVSISQSSALLVLVQQVLCVLNVVLVGAIARRYLSANWTVLAGILFLIEPYHQLYALWLLSTTWFTTVLLVTWQVWCVAQDKRRTGWFVLLGLLAGYLVLIRPVALLIPLVLLVGMVIRVRRERHKMKSLLHSAAPFLLVSVVVLGSWMIRNKVVAGCFSLSHQSGIVLAYFKATEVELWRQGRVTDRYRETSLNPESAALPHTVWDDIDAQTRKRFPNSSPEQLSTLRWPNLAQGNKTTFDSFAVSHALRQVGMSYLQKSPAVTARCCLVRCGSILIYPLNQFFKPPAGVKDFSRLESLLVGAGYLLLSIVVLIKLLRGGLPFATIWFPCASLAAMLLASTPQIDPRFRVPMIPLLVVMALLPKNMPSHSQQ